VSKRTRRGREREREGERESERSLYQGRRSRLGSLDGNGQELVSGSHDPGARAEGALNHLLAEGFQLFGA
jgi:hypothetical protein